MDVLEPADAQRHQSALGGAHEPPKRLALGEEREDHDPERRGAHAEDEPGPEAALEPVVEDLLDEQRHDEAAHGDGERERDREAEARAELGAEAKAPHEHAHRAAQVLGNGQLLSILVGGDSRLLLDGRGHRSPRWYAWIIAP